MARPKKPAKSEPVEGAEEHGMTTDETTAIDDGKILDYITGKPVAENDKEKVRQRIARAMFHEYGISVDDMEPDFRVKIDGSNKKVDVAIFEAGAEHTAFSASSRPGRCPAGNSSEFMLKRLASALLAITAFI